MLRVCFYIAIILGGARFSGCSCSNNKKYTKVDEVVLNEDDEESEDELEKKYGKLPTSPKKVILVGNGEHRLIPIYKQKYTKDGKQTYMQGTYFHETYHQDDSLNVWHYHFMPGIEAAYGYSMHNVGHYNVTTNERNNLFDKPVLVKTIYYPTDVEDTINGQAVTRDYYMITLYNEDSNNDTILNHLDLRKMLLFNMDGKQTAQLIPDQYSVERSQYDRQIDHMYIYARLDENKNGTGERTEPLHVFDLDLKNPKPAKRMY